MRPGPHGIHFHEVGRCDGPLFTSAGEHFNPTGRQHGALNPAGLHSGDLSNFVVAPASMQLGSSYQTINPYISLSTGPLSLFDADGTTLIIHADADDEFTDPSGNSGSRPACAVIQRTTPTFFGFPLSLS